MIDEGDVGEPGRRRDPVPWVPLDVFCARLLEDARRLEEEVARMVGRVDGADPSARGRPLLRLVRGGLGDQEAER